MKRLAAALAATALAALTAAAPASAEFGLSNFGATFVNEDGTMATQAGSHPFAVKASFDIDTREGPLGEPVLEEAAKVLEFGQMPGLAGSPTAVPQCETADFLVPFGGTNATECPDSSAVGVVGVRLAVKSAGAGTEFSPLYNLEPPPHVAAKLGFWTKGVPTTVELGVDEAAPNNIVATIRNPSQILEVIGGDAIIWGVPAAKVHDPLRGRCVDFGGKSIGNCPANIAVRPFLTLPRACQGPLKSTYKANSWLHPDTWVEGFALTHDASGNPKGMTGCGKLAFAPRIESKASTDQAESGSGLDFNLDFNDEGLTNPTGIAGSDTKKAEVVLPEGMTINPSVGEGLGVCTPAELARETALSEAGEGCPDSSKVGTLQVTTPLIDEAVAGQIFLAQQDDASTVTPRAENPFDSLIALYFVLKNPNLGVGVKLPVKVEPDPKTGQLVATLEDIPQFPIAHFNAHLKTGARSALITPATCGTYTTEARLTPWANPSSPLTTTASFAITSGVGGGPCPAGGVPPFHPDFQAGAINNNAGSFSPFNMRLIRKDGEQDMTKFSSVLPPGELGSLRGVGKCPDAAVAIARAKTGRQELAIPSCPANSLIGHTLAGAGVGEALTYVGGQVYLAGPYKGDPLSVISITPAVAGPFDAGTVVVRLALTLNPRTAEVEVDGGASDPIPHILKGIVLKVRDLRVYVDRPNFTLNPTSCNESKAKATLFGSYLNVFDPADDVPVNLSTRYQAANCLNLGFKPKLALSLKGGTKRGGHPGLSAIYQPRAGDANVKGLVVRLPRSAFLDQGHIRTICTRVQFAAKACPKGAEYGHIKAWTPLLDTPLEGPVYLRSSNHKLPDLVFDLHGLVDIEVSTRIDSAQGGIRATLENLPDAPLSKVVLHMQGGKKGLIVNSRNLCGHISKADVGMSGQNGKQHNINPVMRADCGGKRKR